MRKYLLRIPSLAMLVILSIGLGFGQVETPKTRVDKAIVALKAQHPDVKVELNIKTGLPKSIKGLVSPSRQVGLIPKASSQLQDVDKIVQTFFTANQNLFLQNLAEGQPAGIRVTQKKLDPQIPGRAVARVQQTVNGIDVYGAEAAVGVDLAQGEVDKLTSSFIMPPKLDLRPSTKENDARSIARRDYNAELAAHEDTSRSEKAIAGEEPNTSSQLIVFDPSTFNLPSTGPRLTWLVRIGTFLYFVDTKEAKIVHKFRDLSSNRTRSTYDANSTLGLPGKLVIDETGTVPPSSSPCSDATSAHEYAGATYDYYFSTFNRDSYDNKPGGGSPLISTVRYAQLHNAYWSSSTHQMIYGSGFASSPDVVGHEITHGVIEAEVHLQYFGEPGAVNESLADFYGVMVAASKTGILNWKIGTGIPGFSSLHPIRDLASPHNGGFDANQPFSGTNGGQPDYYADIVSASSPICNTTSDRDNGCVHFNSGILNHAFYLAAMGGSGPRGDVVTGIGPQKLAQVLYRTLAGEKLTSTSDMKDIAKGSVEACEELSIAASANISNADCAHLREAYRAVGIP